MRLLFWQKAILSSLLIASCLSGCVGGTLSAAASRTDTLSNGAVGAASDLVRGIEQPFTSSWDAFRKLEGVEKRLIAKGDRRAIFVSVYRRTTFHVATAIDEGKFEDTRWVSQLLTEFANLYREALVNWERGKRNDVPLVWRRAFESAERGENIIVQDVLLGLIAHVARDLPYALERVGIHENRESRHRDHTAVNDVLLRIYRDMDVLLADLYAKPMTGRMGEFMRDPVVNWTFGNSLTLLRELSWHNAVLLSDARFFRTPVVAEIELGATALSDLMRVPQLSPVAVRELRGVEGSMLGSEFCDRFACAQ